MNSLLQKTFTALSIFLIISAAIYAQAPQQMSYQAIIRNSSNTLVTDQQVGMRISILQGSNQGAAVYAETQTPQTNASGLVSLAIGTGIVETGAFASINWAAGPFFIQTETDPMGSNNYSITGTSQLLSVPYALYAATSGSQAGAVNYVQSYTELTTATDNSVVSIAGVSFRINSDLYVEAKSDNENFTTQVFSTTTAHGFGQTNDAPSIASSVSGIGASWTTVATYEVGSVPNENVTFANYYGTQDIEVIVVTFPVGAPRSFKIHVATDGWGRGFLRVQYYY